MFVSGSRENTCERRSFKSFPTDRVFYSKERIAKIAAEAAKEDSIITQQDKLGLLSDATALAVAGYATTSNVLEIVAGLIADKQCKTSFLQSFWCTCNKTLQTSSAVSWQRQQRE